MYLLVFEGLEGIAPEEQATQMLTKRLSEVLSIPILDEWNAALWEAGQQENLIVGLETGGDCLAGFGVIVSETGWTEILTRLIKEEKIGFSICR